MDSNIKQQEKIPYPKSVLFIMGNEFCERFSYYGMRTILILYLTNILLLSENKATVVNHVFMMLAYFSPLVGAIICDSYLGKFKTILYVSILYTFGNVAVAISSIPDLHLPVLETTLLGLLIIGIGSGGIKPCVVAFGCDQFTTGQESQQRQFFSVYYLCINLGSLFSTFLTPLLRAHVTCFGADTCYPLAFGLPAVLMVVSIILFLLGRSFYKIYPPKDNVLVNVTKITYRAIFRRFSSVNKRDHWLDYADDEYDEKLISDVKALYKVLCIYLPLPFFWALYDQQGSRWTLQANKMNGELGFINFTIQPDQIQVLNPLFLIVFVVFMEMVLYPLFNKCGILITPLQKMCFGGFLASFSFVLAALIEIQLEKTLPIPIGVDKSEFTLVNSLPCALKVDFGDKMYEIPPFSNQIMPEFNSNLNYTGIASFSQGNFSDCPLNRKISGEFIVFPENGKAFTLGLSVINDSITYKQGEDPRQKAFKGKSDVRLVYNLLNSRINISIGLNSIKGGKNYRDVLLVNDSAFGLTHFVTSIEPDEYEVRFGDIVASGGNVKMKQGGVYTVVLYETKNSEIKLNVLTVVDGNTLSMFLQVPQYIVITFAEIFFSITGLEFSYTQAPASMKSVLQGVWLLMVAFGNVIVVIIAEADFFSKQSNEFFLFAGLMMIDVIIFAIMAYFYVYVKEENIASDVTKISENVRTEINLGFEDDKKV